MTQLEIFSAIKRQIEKLHDEIATNSEAISILSEENSGLTDVNEIKRQYIRLRMERDLNKAAGIELADDKVENQLSNIIEMYALIHKNIQLDNEKIKLGQIAQGFSSKIKEEYREKKRIKDNDFFLKKYPWFKK